MLSLHKIPSGLSFFSPTVLLASFAGTGLIKPASGTWGSLAAFAIGFHILLYYNWLYLFFLSITLYLVGLWACSRWLRHDNESDPSAIVIDEAAGLFLALALIPYPRDNLPALACFGLGFIMFRLFDIFKPWPVSYFDKKIKGAQGIMLDDMVAGLLAALTTALLSLGMPDVP
ncbi:MAG: phosphatidylglycerophosphatase A [Parvibaculales bacterium]